MDSWPETTTRAWVLLPDIKTKLRHRSTKYSLVEAVSLANALPNLTVVGELVVYFRSVHPGTFFGKGKISELEAIFKSSNVELVLIDAQNVHVGQWDHSIQNMHLQFLYHKPLTQNVLSILGCLCALYKVETFLLDNL